MNAKAIAAKLADIESAAVPAAGVIAPLAILTVRRDRLFAVCTMVAPETYGARYTEHLEVEHHGNDATIRMRAPLGTDPLTLLDELLDFVQTESPIPWPVTS